MSEDPQYRANKRRAYWRRNGGRFLGFGLVLVLGVTGFALHRAGLLTGLAPDEGSAAPGKPKINLSTPFLGTEAGLWADGAAGIELPAAEKLGRYSAEQVKAFAEQVRAVVIAGRLDRRVIVQGQVQHVLDLLAPEARENFDETMAEAKLSPEGGSFLHTRIAPGYTLLQAEPKVKGEFKVYLGDKGKLTASTNYVMAYAFDPEQPEKINDPHELIAMQRRQTEFYLEDDPKLRKSARGLVWQNTKGFDYLMTCAESEKELLAPTYRERQKPVTGTTGPQAKHDEKHYFDPNSPLDVEDGCKK